MKRPLTKIQKEILDLEKKGPVFPLDILRELRKTYPEIGMSRVLSCIRELQKKGYHFSYV